MRRSTLTLRVAKVSGIVVFVALLAAPSVAPAAGLQTTQDLYEACRGERGTSFETACAGYVRGYVDRAYFDSLSSRTKIETMVPSVNEIFTGSIIYDYLVGSALCIPDEMFGNLKPLIQIFINWAEAHPKQWGEPAVAGLHYALVEAYPCAWKNRLTPARPLEK